MAHSRARGSETVSPELRRPPALREPLFRLKDVIVFIQAGMSIAINRRSKAVK